MYDIEISIGAERATMRGMTLAGHDVLRGLVAEYRDDRAHPMILYPDQFMEFVPPNVRVGVKTIRSKKFVLMSKNHLH